MDLTLNGVQRYYCRYCIKIPQSLPAVLGEWAVIVICVPKL